MTDKGDGARKVVKWAGRRFVSQLTTTPSEIQQVDDKSTDHAVKWEEMDQEKSLSEHETSSTSQFATILSGQRDDSSEEHAGKLYKDEEQDQKKQKTSWCNERTSYWTSSFSEEETDRLLVSKGPDVTDSFELLRDYCSGDSRGIIQKLLDTRDGGECSGRKKHYFGVSDILQSTNESEVVKGTTALYYECYDVYQDDQEIVAKTFAKEPSTIEEGDTHKMTNQVFIKEYQKLVLSLRSEKKKEKFKSEGRMSTWK